MNPRDEAANPCVEASNLCDEVVKGVEKIFKDQQKQEGVKKVIPLLIRSLNGSKDRFIRLISSFLLGKPPSKDPFTEFIVRRSVVEEALAGESVETVMKTNSWSNETDLGVAMKRTILEYSAVVEERIGCGFDVEINADISRPNSGVRFVISITADFEKIKKKFKNI